VKTLPLNSIQSRESGIIVDSDLLASFFDISVTSLRDAMHAGNLSTLVEIGEGEDSGRTRLTFRYSGKQFSLMREKDDQLYQTAPPSPNVRAIKPSLMQLLDTRK
jgi:hypothetical protein